MAVDSTIIGSAGHIIAAALETSGQYIQSQFLDVLANGLAYSLGALLYLMSAISALFIYAMGGKYKFSLWFFIGPPLFFQCVFVRLSSQGAAWNWGNRNHSQELVYLAAQGIAADKSGTGSSTTATAREMDISWFFGEWNKFTSGIVQTTLSLFKVDDRRSDLHFVNQVSKYAGLFRGNISDPELKKFVSLVTTAKCSRYLAQIMKLNNFAVDQSFTGESVKEEIAKEKVKVVFNSNSDPELQKWLETSGIRDLAVGVLPQKFNSEGKLIENQALTCDDVWRLSVSLARSDAAGLVEGIISHNTSSDEERDLARTRLLNKFATKTNNQDGTVQYFDGLSDEDKAVALVNEVAVNMIVKELRSLNPEIAQMNYVPTRLTKAEGGKYVSPDVARSLRLFSEYDQYQGKGDLLAAAQALPYIQGLLLFFLSAAYPFFAFALLIPGRHHAMLLWMGLWFWAKSWDIGFALVMLIDDILYSFMPHGTPMTDDIANDPLQALKTAFEVDPTYSEATYYNLISACMLSIPAIMGVFIKTGGGEILSAINQGFKDFSGTIGKSVSLFMHSSKSQELIRDMDQRVLQGIQDNYLNAFLQKNVLDKVGSKNLYNLASTYFGDKNTYGERARALTAGGRDKMIGLFSNEINKAFAGLGAAEVDRKKAELVTEIKANLNKARSITSFRPENYQLAYDAVFLRYYSHDFMRPWPAAQIVGQVQASANYQSYKAISGSPLGFIESLGARRREEGVDHYGISKSFGGGGSERDLYDSLIDQTTKAGRPEEGSRPVVIERKGFSAWR